MTKYDKVLDIVANLLAVIVAYDDYVALKRLPSHSDPIDRSDAWQAVLEAREAAGLDEGKR